MSGLVGDPGSNGVGANCIVAMYCSASNASFFPVLPQKSVNMSLSYVLHFSKQFPVCGAVANELHNVVYSAGTNSCCRVCVCVCVCVSHYHVFSVQSRTTSL